MSSLEILIERRIARRRAELLDENESHRRERIQGGLAELYLIQSDMKLQAKEDAQKQSRKV